jgi:hypothetical protein
VARQSTQPNGSRAPSPRRPKKASGKRKSPKDLDGDGTAPVREYRTYSEHEGDPGPDPDVLLDVPLLKVDSIHLELDDLDAHVALKAQVLDLVTLTVGIDAHLGKVRLDIEGVEAQAMLKVRLDHVTAIIDRVLTTIDRNPELIESLGGAVEDLGVHAGHALNEIGGAVEHIGKGLEGAVNEVGEGAGQAVSQIGEGAGQAVNQIGGGAGQAVGQVGDGLGRTTRKLVVRRGVRKLVTGAGKTVLKAIKTVGSDVKKVGHAATHGAKELST